MTRKLVPPLSLRISLDVYAGLHLVESVLLRWVVHVDQYLVEYHGKLAHLHETGRGVGWSWRIVLSRKKFDAMWSP